MNLSNKIYPIYYGLSADLVFFVAINTIFLTNVKHFNAAQINSLTTFSIIVMLLVYYFVIKIIEKIGNVLSVKIANYMLLVSAILITLCKSYTFILIGYIFYSCSFLFKGMDSVILRKNLKYQNKLNEYINYQNKGTLIYSFVTMIISFISGFMFNINQYLPMIICIIFCINNCILTNFIYEVKTDEKEAKEPKEKMKFSKIIIYILLTYSILYTCIELGQVNTKLFLQYNMSDFLSQDKVVIIFSLIISLSRIVRVISNIIFNKLCKKIKNKITFIIDFLLIAALILILLGNFIGREYIGIVIMATGFLIFLGIRDPLENSLRTNLLNNCKEKYHKQAVVYFTLSRKIGNLVISLLITCILLKFHIKYVILFLLLIGLLLIFIITKLYNLLKQAN